MLLGTKNKGGFLALAVLLYSARKLISNRRMAVLSNICL